MVNFGISYCDIQLYKSTYKNSYRLALIDFAMPLEYSQYHLNHFV